MPTLIVRLKKIHMKSLREFEDLTIDFKKLNGINLMQIQNGYGKTTIHQLLRHIFTGNLPPDDQLKSFRYKRSFGGQRDKSEFWVDLEINNKEYRIGIVFDHEENSAQFITISPEHGGKEYEWRPPQIFKTKFFNKNSLVKLFIFDGEMAKDLNKTQGAGIIEESIRQITNLHILFDYIKQGATENDKGQLQSIIDNVLKEKEVKTVDSTYQKYLTYLQTCRDHIQECRHDADQIKQEIDIKKAILDKIINAQEEIDKKNKEIWPEIQKISEQRDLAKQNLNQSTVELLDALFNPSNLPGDLWNQVKEYHTSFEKKKIPASIGKQFITELLDDIKCLCGTPWTKEMRRYVEENKEKYFGEDLLFTIKSMQGAIRQIDGDKDLDILAEHIVASESSVNKAETEIQDLRNQFDAEASKKLNELQDQRNKVNLDIEDLEFMLQEIMETDLLLIKQNDFDKGIQKTDGSTVMHPGKFKECKNIYSLSKVEANLVRQLSKIADVRSLNRGAEVVTEVLQLSLNRLMGKLRQSVIIKADRILQTIRATGGGLQLKSFNKGLQFTNSFGEIQDDVNMAAQLAGAYSYVTAMYEFGEIEVPLIIDSPVTGFGAGVAEDWAREIPEKFPQVIALITSLEKAGLLEMINDKKKNIYLSTIRRKDEKLNGKPQVGKMICDDNEKFFINYEMEKVKENLSRRGS